MAARHTVYLWSRITSGEVLYHPIAVHQSALPPEPVRARHRKMAHLAKSPAVLARLDDLAVRLTADLGLQPTVPGGDATRKGPPTGMSGPSVGMAHSVPVRQTTPTDPPTTQSRVNHY